MTEIKKKFSPAPSASKTYKIRTEINIKSSIKTFVITFRKGGFSIGLYFIFYDYFI